jgi:geranylgeranyl reductase family protein
MNSMDHRKKCYDVIIIGAGPAGSTAAYILASNGLDVLIVDKCPFPRDKLCGGLLTMKTIQLIEKIFALSAESMKDKRLITSQSIDYKIGSFKGASVKRRLHYPFHFTDRRVYDAFWLTMAKKAGAMFRAGDKVVALDLPHRKLATSSGCEYFADYILAADGALSRTRRELSAAGLIAPKRRPEMATTLEVFISNRHLQHPTDCPAIYFGHIPWGYTWSFPGEHYRTLGIVGLNVKSGKSLRKRFSKFLASLDIRAEIIPRYKSHALPYGNYLSVPGQGNVLLLGDACGLADPLLGEGIYYAHKSAQLASIAILNSYDNPQAVFRSYSQKLATEVIRELSQIRMLRQITFSLPGIWPYMILSLLLKALPKQCEAAVQGERPIRWFGKRII